MTDLEQTPRLILLLGVAGSGKTTLGRLLAERLGYTFLDADDFHSSEAINRMRSGMPLTDATRDAWVNRIQAALTGKYQQKTSCVLAFSGLRARHRKQLMRTGFDTRAFLLQGTAQLLTRRLEQRQDHFMNVSQLQDQLASMQPVDADEDIETVDIEASPADIVAALVRNVDR